jgi:threonyl-tRNA synthetase
LFNFQAANAQQVLTEIKASNQQAHFLGNKVEMAITQAIEKNKSILKVGLHFEFGDCR